MGKGDWNLQVPVPLSGRCLFLPTKRRIRISWSAFFITWWITFTLSYLPFQAYRIMGGPQCFAMREAALPVCLKYELVGSIELACSLEK